MAAKLASTGNGRNPMALVTSCGMSRENKIEFSGMRHTHGIQLYRKPPWRVISVVCRTLPRMPLIELSLRGHFFKVEAAAQVNHGHHLGKAAGGPHEGRSHPAGWSGLWQGKDFSSFPQAPRYQPTLSELYSGWEQGCPFFVLNQCPFPILWKVPSLGSFSMSHHT